MDLTHSAGYRIRDLRTKLDYSQEEVADRAAIYVLILSNMERGPSDPRRDTVQRAHALQVPTAAILQHRSTRTTATPDSLRSRNGGSDECHGRAPA